MKARILPGILLVTALGCGGGGGGSASPSPPTPVNTAPTVTASALAINEDEPGTVTITATDAENDALSVQVTTAPAKGAVTISAANPFTATYTPGADKNGTDTFTVTVTDARGASTNAAVAVTIKAQPDAPNFAAQTFTGNEDAALNGQLVASDADGDTLAFTSLTQPAHGTLALTGGTGAFTYTPAPDYFGADTFDVKVSDGGLTRSAAISLTVTPVDDAPIAGDDEARVPGAAADVDVLANDSDLENDALTASVETQPAGATATVVGNKIHLVPTPGWVGPSFMKYRVTDAGGASTIALIHLVIGTPRTLFYYTGTAGTTERRIRRFDYLQNIELDTPVPAGETLDSFTTSADGTKLVYVTRSSVPVHRLWLRDLVDTALPAVEITTPVNFFVNDLAISPDGSLVAYNENLASTLTPSMSSKIDVIGPVSNATFTRDSRKVFYTALLAAGGHMIKRADVTAAGVVSNRTQMTANYTEPAGAGVEFRLTPDETKIVSLGLFMPGVGNSIKQYALVTTANGSKDDAVIHPEFTNPVDGVVDLPRVADDSRHVVYRATLTGTSGAFESDLQAPGGVFNIAADSPYVFSLLPNGSDRALYSQGTTSQQMTWYSRGFSTGVAADAFAPLADPAPRVVAVVPGSSAVVFDSGRNIMVTPGYPFASSDTLASLPATDSTPALLRVSPDSSGAIAIGTLGTGLTLNPRAPGWYSVLSPSPTSTFGTMCVAYAGERC